MREVDLLIVGAGPAGLAAAGEAKALGLQPVVIDENPLEEAWIRRQLPLFFGERAAGSAKVDGNVVYRWLERPAIREALAAGIEVLPQHAVWGLFKQLNDPGFEPVTVGVHHGGETSLWAAKQLIIASGAAEMPVPFAGWELGGVLGGLGALRLFETFGRIDGKRLLVVGSGPLAVQVCHAAMERGMTIAGAVEIGPEPAAPVLWRRIGAELHVNSTVLRAEGAAEVERVVLAPVDADGTPTGASGPTIEADTVVIAIGGQPSPELPFMARCEFAFDRALGGAYPRHDEHMRTSRSNILVAGDAAGMPGFQPAGVPRSTAQARIAAISAAESLGAISAADAEARRAPLRWFAAPATEPAGPYLTPWHRAADLLAGDGVHLCRCEEVSKGTVARTHGFYVSGGFPDEVKRFSRAGMGFCQGRLCRPILGGTIAALNGQPLDTQPMAAWRPPLRPLPISALATEEVTAFDLENELEPGAWIDWWFLGNYEPREHAGGRMVPGESMG